MTGHILCIYTFYCRCNMNVQDVMDNRHWFVQNSVLGLIL